LKTTDEHQATLEHISALLDGENGDTEKARTRLGATEGASLRYRQYHRMRTLIHDLPAPEVSPEFANRVLARTTPTHRWVHVCAYGVAAAAMLLVLGAWFHFFYLPPPETPFETTAVLLDDTAIASLAEDVDETAIWLYLADISDHFGLSFPIALVETLPEETLLGLLAESTLEETLYTPNAEAKPDQEPELYPEFADIHVPSFLEIFEFVDKLDEAEAMALNNALRSALQEV